MAPLASANDPVAAIFGCSLADAGGDHAKHRAARRSLGQLVLGRMAEQVFERRYRREVGSEDLVLEDSRKDRNDTDYRVLNGRGRPVFRINIKFHGTLFRRAQELVSLDPEDCFALATYKIYQGLSKEGSERLPYVFLVVSAPNVTGAAVGEEIPDDVARFATVIRAAVGVSGLKKRDVEDRIVSHLVGTSEGGFAVVRDRIVDELEQSDWRAISATKASLLLREFLFQRVYAVRVRGFAQNYRNAELDMHFSLSTDLTPLHQFFEIYKDGGLHLLASKLSRGDI